MEASSNQGKVILAEMSGMRMRMGYASAPEVEHFEHRLSRCHRRYIEATVALARVRKLGLNVQINVAQNQIVANG